MSQSWRQMLTAIIKALYAQFGASEILSVLANVISSEMVEAAESGSDKIAQLLEVQRDQIRTCAKALEEGMRLKVEG